MKRRGGNRRTPGVSRGVGDDTDDREEGMGGGADLQGKII